MSEVRIPQIAAMFRDGETLYRNIATQYALAIDELSAKVAELDAVKMQNEQFANEIAELRRDKDR